MKASACKVEERIRVFLVSWLLCGTLRETRSDGSLLLFAVGSLLNSPSIQSPLYLRVLYSVVFVFTIDLCYEDLVSVMWDLFILRDIYLLSWHYISWKAYYCTCCLYPNMRHFKKMKTISVKKLSMYLQLRLFWVSPKKYYLVLRKWLKTCGKWY